MMHSDNGPNVVTRSTSENDLRLAREVFLKDGVTLVVVKNGRILFRSKSHGISDLLTMIDDLGRSTEGASLADSIVGRAAALLCVYSGIVAVYGAKLSKGAQSVLNASGVRCEFGTLVPSILNRKKDDICPYDRAVQGIDDPSVALEKLKSL
jgi:hypothetical protein